MLRVLVGADLGRTSEAARTFAARLAAHGSIEVEVMFVASPEQAHHRLGLDPPMDAELSPEAEAALVRELSAAAPAAETRATLRVVSGRGRADAHLVARADRGGFDLIVVGTRHRSIVEQVGHGSIARGVLQSAPVSVVQVPLPIGAPDLLFRPPRVVVVAAEFTEVDHRALAHAMGYAAPDATVHVAHVVGAFGSPSEVSQARQDAAYQLSKLGRDIAVDQTTLIHTHVLEGVATDQLLALSERVGADLIVLGVRKRTAIGRVVLGSLARALVEDSRFPVLLVPARRP